MTERQPLYGIGDKVKIVNYGHLIWENKEVYPKPSTSFPIYHETENVRWLDMSPHLVGRMDLIEKVSVVQGTPKYSLNKNGAWFAEENLELVNKNPNNK